MGDDFEIFFEGPSATAFDARERFLALRMFLGLEFDLLAIDSGIN